MPLYRDIKTVAPDYEPLPFYTSEVEEEMDLATWLREASAPRVSESAELGILADTGDGEAELEPTVDLGGGEPSGDGQTATAGE
jgi:hypothetical protein